MYVASLQLSAQEISAELGMSDTSKICGDFGLTGKPRSAYAPNPFSYGDGCCKSNGSVRTSLPFNSIYKN